MSTEQSKPGQDTIFAIEKYISENTLRVLVPQRYLWGIQEASEFSNKRKKQIEQMLRFGGQSVLLRKPAQACAVPLPQNNVMLVIQDGHHRSRYAPNEGISEIPVTLRSISLMSLLENKPEDVLIDEYVHLTSVALGSFTHMNSYKYPLTIPNIDSFMKLKALFKSF